MEVKIVKLQSGRLSQLNTILKTCMTISIYKASNLNKAVLNYYSFEDFVLGLELDTF